MGFEIFFTQPAANAAPGTKSGTTQNAPSGALGFVEFIVSLIKSSEEAENSTKQLPLETQLSLDKTPLQSDNPTLDKKPSLALTALLATDPEMRRSIEELKLNGTFDKAALEKILELLQTNNTTPGNESFLAIFPERGEFLNALTNAQDITNAKGDVQKNLLVKKLQSILDKITLGSSQPNPVEGLILEDTSAEQLEGLGLKIISLITIPPNEIQPAINELAPEEKKLIYDALSALVGVLQTPATKPVLSPSGNQTANSMMSVAPDVAETSDLNSIPADLPQDVAQSLNDINVGESTKKAENLQPFFVSQPDKKTGEMIARDADAMIEALSNGKASGENSQAGELQNTLNPKASNSKNPQSSNNSGFAPVAGLFAPLQDSLNLASNATASDNFAGSMMAAQYSPAGASRSVNTPVAMSGAHPATQMVAVTLQKSANDQQNRNFILQLDPPELGRVEVRLNFTKEKSLKTVLMTERSDTLALLQKDSHFLERVLQNSGIEMDSSGLSFEMAPDGYFNDGNQGNGNGGFKNSPDAVDGLNDINPVERMTWFIDPQSGTLHYNILA